MECPNHGGNFDCTPFCELCEGEQEFVACAHLETVECTCGECQSCPPEARGRECADCGDELYDCPAGCGATVGVDAEGFLQYCVECGKQQENIKNAYLTLAYAIIKNKEESNG